MSSVRPLFVVAGVGNATGTGASAARLFAQKGYKVALISRGPESLNKLAEELSQHGGEAAGFPVQDYSPNPIRAAFAAIRSHFPPSSSPLRVALFNAAHGVWKPFLETSDEELHNFLDINIGAAFAFSREVITEFLKLRFEGPGEGGQGGARKRGTLLFTGTDASIRGNVTSSAFAAGKRGLRALSQSLAKEFGKKNIHVAHSVIDGSILTDRTRTMFNSPEWETNVDGRVDSNSIAKTFLDLVQQDSSAWTWEIDLRPAHAEW
ncbi:hypothetical protein EDD16DRAFT_1898649 [Pisolithus croceorrhizus]|nr:hypothetical protein EV401DRAFT_2214659 [Pisolithus croceorrhizus]KAI6107761.1 hypothetical protein EDD16DRAFT_1898649 [Pisolithus croceorrhizus]KAI6150009.1 hypothetical protein EDD17DRAFT_1766193 [Pisolithus thermaeus]